MATQQVNLYNPSISDIKRYADAARVAHTWWTAARDAIKLREPLAPEVIEAAAAEAFGYEGGLQEVNLGDLLHFARVLEQRHGIGA